MSRYHETAVWQSENGTWTAAFYSVSYHGYDEDGDDEWSREFDYNSFEWASSGHQTEDDAIRSNPNSNPGGWNVHTFDRDPDMVRKLDEIYWAYRNPEEAKAKAEEAEAEWRKEGLLNSIIPALGQPVTIKEHSRAGSGVSYTGTLRKDESGAIIAEHKDFQGRTKSFVLFTPTGRVASGHKVSSIEAKFSLPVYGRGFDSPKPRTGKCGAATNKGICQRDTYGGPCWQHY